jgi:phospholipid/cholesterol/gamma-HCH transport system substrate-binding protein
MRRHQRRGMSLTTIGVIALLVTLVAVYLGFTKSIPFKSHYEITAAFKTSNNLRPNSPVRVAGVNVGKVTKVEHATDGGQDVLVTMRINDAGRPIHKDAEMAIRPRIFLEGNFFVDVSPGTPSAPVLEDGDRIPVNQTRTPVQLDQVLTALQSDTRDDLKVLLREYSEALHGRDDAGAKAFNRSIEHWEPAYKNSAIVAEAQLGLAEHDLSGYIEHAGTVAAALDRSPENLKSLITDFNATARAFASESGNLQAAIRELPRTLRAAQPALGELNEAFPPLRALAKDLTPGVRSSLPAIRASRPFVAQLRGLFSEGELRGLTRDLRAGVPGLTTFTTEGIPFSRESRRLSSCTSEILVPWANSKVGDKAFPAADPVYQEAPKLLPGIAAESRSGDANGQWFRVFAAGGTNLVTFKPGVFGVTAQPLLGANPRRPDNRPPLISDKACEAQELPDLESIAGRPPQQRRIDMTDPKHVKGWAEDKKILLELAEKTLKRQGLDDELKVVDSELTLEQVKALARGGGK